MQKFDDSDLRELLACYEVPEPPRDIVQNIKNMMCRELSPDMAVAMAPASQERSVFMLVGLTVAMSLCMFYMFTVGTVLRFVLPQNLLDTLSYSLYVLTGAGGIVLACTLMVLVFRQYFLNRSVVLCDTVR